MIRGPRAFHRLGQLVWAAGGNQPVRDRVGRIVQGEFHGGPHVRPEHQMGASVGFGSAPPTGLVRIQRPAARQVVVLDDGSPDAQPGRLDR